MKTGRTADKSMIYAPQRLGPKRSMTPEGFLLCEDVPVARTGTMLYGENEVPVDSAGNGLIYIERTPEEVFAALTLASAEGKPVTIGHPAEFVEPANFGGLAQGTMLNVRRGEGIEDDFMFADLLITGADAIRAVQQDGIEEVSLGYQADYEQVAPGRGVQRNIVVNHCALVERGRCGPRCAIGDQAMSKKLSFADRIRRAFQSKDAEEAEKIAKEAEDAEREEAEEEERKKAEKATSDALKPVMDAIKAVRDDLEDLKKKVEDEDDKVTADTVINVETGEKLDQAGVKLYTGDAAKLVQQRAEILNPGLRVPTFDAKTTDAQRAVALCGCKRKALDAAYATEEGRAAIDPFLQGASIAKLTHDQLNAVFIGSSELLRAKNNSGARAAVSTKDFGKAVTADSVNAANNEFWSKRIAGH